MTEAHWRPMRQADLDGVVSVAAACFPQHFERPACFAERLDLFAPGCFVLDLAGSVRGYLIAYPWVLGEIPPLDSLLGRLPDRRDAWYLHDLALHPDVRGRGLARPIIERLVEEALMHGADRIALVSVNDTGAFWRSNGFVPAAGSEAIAGKLASYGEGAIYMIRPTGKGAETD